ncbi:hypothetical protein [Romboutsia sp.]|uniref:hypothetical protein n=1 Tax=Romboutsia sp. TaxID=1965302 RepID=UPI002C0FCD6F|nr:hypothetical protein [Romboutsia sp.]HSQ88703.1 hypothetical protein [Romboutsia sp.]
MQIDKRIQERDLKALDFINNCKICTRAQIQEVIYPGIDESVCIRRLRLLDELKLVSRARFNINEKSNQYVYYPYKSKKPSKRLLAHDLTVTEFIAALYKANIEVVKVERVSPIGNVIPDAYIVIKTSTGAIKRLLIEVQLSGKLEDCVVKYKGFKEQVIKHKPKWQSIPTLIVVSDLEGERLKVRHMNVKYTNTSMENIRNLIFGE